MNTDAEGRLIMADAIAYGMKRYKPDMLMDMATLTGQAHTISNGEFSILVGRNIPMYKTNYQEWLQELKERKEECVILPFRKEYLERMRTKEGEVLSVRYDDRSNIYQSVGFLGNFIPDDLPWLHMDISQGMNGNLSGYQGHASMVGILAFVHGWDKWMRNISKKE
jgi:leucyl aminopeptidase